MSATTASSVDDIRLATTTNDGPTSGAPGPDAGPAPARGGATPLPALVRSAFTAALPVAVALAVVLALALAQDVLDATVAGRADAILGTIPGALVATFVLAIVAGQRSLGFCLDAGEARFVAALPVRREHVLAASALGCLLALAAGVGVVGLGLAVGRASSGASLGVAALWTGSGLLACLAYGGVALLSCVLAGSVVGAAGTYLTLVLGPALLGYLAEIVASMVLPGVPAFYGSILPMPWYASPLAGPIASFYDAWSGGSSRLFALAQAGWPGSLVPWAVAGVACVALAVALFVRRPVENVGHMLAFAPARKVAVALAALAAGLFVPTVLSFTVWLGDNNPYQLPGDLVAATYALVVGVTAAVGAGLSLAPRGARQVAAASRAQLARTLRPALVAAGIAVAFCLACAGDVLGLVHYVPDASQVEYASASAAGLSPNDVEGTIQLHRALLDCLDQGKLGASPSDPYCSYVTINYQLRDGSQVTRNYLVDASPNQVAAPGTPANALRAYMLSPATGELTYTYLAAMVGEGAKGVLVMDTGQRVDLTNDEVNELMDGPLDGDAMRGGLLLDNTFLLDSDGPAGATLDIGFDDSRSLEVSDGMYATGFAITLARNLTPRTIAWLEANKGVSLW